MSTIPTVDHEPIKRYRVVQALLSGLVKIGAVHPRDIAVTTTRTAVYGCLQCEYPALVTKDEPHIVLPISTPLNVDGHILKSAVEQMGLYYNRRLGRWSNIPL